MPYPWSTGNVLTASDLNSAFAAKLASADYKPGMVQIASSALSGSAVSVNNCFSSAYSFYRIVASIRPSTSMTYQFRLRASGSDLTATNYSAGSFEVRSTSATAINSVSSGANIANLFADGSGAALGALSLDIINPFASEPTRGHGTYSGIDSGGTYSRFGILGFNFTASTQADGFTLSTSTGTFSGGVVKVFGYRD